MNARAEDPVDALRRQCAAVGFDLDAAGAPLLERVRLVAERSESFDDALRLSSLAYRVFRYYDAAGKPPPFNPVERRIVVLGSLFSDIGKTGPAHASAADRCLVVEAFAVENVRDDQQPMTEFFRAHFPADAEERIARFAALGLEPTMSLRAFWNLHAGWTLEIAEAARLPPEVTAAAASHHLLDEVNPSSIVGDDARFTRDFGENIAFDRAEKLIILLDKYDAVRRRGHRTHEEAIAWLRDRLDRSERFRDDTEFRAVLSAIADALA